MLKCHSELFKSSVKLADGLRLSTKEELKDVAQLLLLPIPSKLRKEEYVSCLAEAVLTCPDIWIPQLTHYEWLLLQKLVKAGANTYVEEPNDNDEYIRITFFCCDRPWFERRQDSLYDL